MTAAAWRYRAIGGATLLLGGALALAAAATFHPARIEGAEVTGSAPPLVPGQRLVVLVWNIQFAAGRGRHFFYDGGQDVAPTAEEVAATLDGIADVLRRVDADLVLLQEVDRGSTRTDHVDQLAVLAGRVGYPVRASATVHRAPWVPWPPHRHLGRVDTHIGVLSRFGVSAATRVALPPMNDGWLRRQLDLKRAILEVALPLSDGRRFTVLDTHLSAFSHGDGTLPRQVAVVTSRIDAMQGPWLLGGDLNALPPGDDAARLGLDATDYPEAQSPIAPLFARLRSAIPLAEHHRRPESWRTWMPWGSHVAERAIDHVFVSPDVEVARASVLRDVTSLSDHLPILVEVVLPR